MRKSKEAKTVTTLARAKGRARPKFDEPLAKVQKALRATQAEVNRERQARIKAEKALIEAREELAAARLEAESQAQRRRVSFVVRLTLDEHGQFGRTEIEHVSSSRKQNFLSLDGERLVEFMKACLNPINILEDAIPTGAPKQKIIISSQDH